MDKTDKTIALYYEREAETGPAGPGRCVAKCPCSLKFISD